MTMTDGTQIRVFLLLVAVLIAYVIGITLFSIYMAGR